MICVLIKRGDEESDTQGIKTASKHMERASYGSTHLMFQLHRK
jgi:hypothetical protein